MRFVTGRQSCAVGSAARVAQSGEIGDDRVVEGDRDIEQGGTSTRSLGLHSAPFRVRRLAMRDSMMQRGGSDGPSDGPVGTLWSGSPEDGSGGGVFTGFIVALRSATPTCREQP
jgi:hypothetical protein